MSEYLPQLSPFNNLFKTLSDSKQRDEMMDSLDEVFSSIGYDSQNEDQGEYEKGKNFYSIEYAEIIDDHSANQFSLFFVWNDEDQNARARLEFYEVAFKDGKGLLSKDFASKLKSQCFVSDEKSKISEFFGDQIFSTLAEALLYLFASVKDDFEQRHLQALDQLEKFSDLVKKKKELTTIVVVKDEESDEILPFTPLSVEIDPEAARSFLKPLLKAFQPVANPINYISVLFSCLPDFLTVKPAEEDVEYPQDIEEWAGELDEFNRKNWECHIHTVKIHFGYDYAHLFFEGWIPGEIIGSQEAVKSLNPIEIQF